jgi:Trk K+ transport system NAD-binding subunit
VLARVYDPQRAHIYAALGLEIISGTILFAAMLRDKIIESRFTSYLIETKDLGVIEIDIKGHLVGKTPADINIPGGLMAVALRRIGGVTIPDEKTVFQDKDKLMAVVKVDELEKIKAKLGI